MFKHKDALHVFHTILIHIYSSSKILIYDMTYLV